MSSEIRNQILSKIGEYGTGVDTLRCLALATIDEPLAKGDMDLQVSFRHITFFKLFLGLYQIRNI